jgi:uncharacterized protein YceH (UPF0502 family)
MEATQPVEGFPPLKQLTRAQRRVLGTMIEKGITVPESYPLTLKALTTGCTQKSARDPITNYSEDDVLETLDQLRELGLAAVVHTESGRTERYRHYLRRQMPNLSEPQVAVLAELLLRGRQPVGDLRGRASRMAPAGSLDALEQLRSELNGLAQLQLVRSDGPLDRRGIEVDHNLYEPQEARAMPQRTFDDEPPARAAPPVGAHASVATTVPAAKFTAPQPIALASGGESSSRSGPLEAAVAALRTENGELRADLAALDEKVNDLATELQRLREALGA